MSHPPQAPTPLPALSRPFREGPGSPHPPPGRRWPSTCGARMPTQQGWRGSQGRSFPSRLAVTRAGPADRGPGKAGWGRQGPGQTLLLARLWPLHLPRPRLPYRGAWWRCQPAVSTLPCLQPLGGEQIGQARRWGPRHRTASCSDPCCTPAGWGSWAANPHILSVFCFRERSKQSER